MPPVTPPPLTPARLAEEIEALLIRYPALTRRTLGKSLLGREIPLLLLGTGARTLLYVATHHALEWLTSRLLLCFIGELAAAATKCARPYGIELSYLLSERTLAFVPMLNPDGVAIALGEGGDILAERRARMVTGGDFSRWQANARGVDLNHNYRTGFREYKKIEAALGISEGAPTRYSGQAPESEPEVAALVGFIRTVMPAFVLSLHTQGEEIYYAGGGVELQGAGAMAARFSRLTGYRVAVPEGPSAYGGLCDYTTAELGIPSFTVECGRGENPLPAADALPIYSRLRRFFFETVMM